MLFQQGSRLSIAIFGVHGQTTMHQRAHITTGVLYQMMQSRTANLSPGHISFTLLDARLSLSKIHLTNKQTENCKRLLSASATLFCVFRSLSTLAFKYSLMLVLASLETKTWWMLFTSSVFTLLSLHLASKRQYHESPFQVFRLVSLCSGLFSWTLWETFWGCYPWQIALSGYAKNRFHVMRPPTAIRTTSKVKLLCVYVRVSFVCRILVNYICFFPDMVGTKHCSWGRFNMDSRYPDRMPQSLKELQESGQ